MSLRDICVDRTEKSTDESIADHPLQILQEESQAMLQDPPCRLYALGEHAGTPASSPNGALDICRICHCEGDLEAPLIAPCFCAGSLRYVHQACLQQWIKSSDTKNCELCKYEFAMQTKIKPFRKWEKLVMSPMEGRKVLCSVTFHMVAITCVVWSLYVLIDRTAEEIRDGALEWPLWTKLIVVTIGFTGALVFMYVQCKMYVQLCRRWRAFNRVIYVQNAPVKVLHGNALTHHNGTLAGTPCVVDMVLSATDGGREKTTDDSPVNDLVKPLTDTVPVAVSIPVAVPEGNDTKLNLVT